MHQQIQRKIINTSQAPEAIGTYSQAVKLGNTVFISGQISLDPVSGQLVGTDVKSQLFQAFDNLAAIAKAAGGSLNEVVKLTIYLLDMAEFAVVNECMARCFNEPYPARAVVAVVGLPKNSLVEVDAVMVVDQHVETKF